MKNLRSDGKLKLHDVNMARSTRAIPLCLQYDNTEPDRFFDKLIKEFNSSMAVLRAKISETESYFLYDSMFMAPMSVRELSALFDKVSRGFVTLAARLNLIHEAVCIHFQITIYNSIQWQI